MQPTQSEKNKVAAANNLLSKAAQVLEHLNIISFKYLTSEHLYLTGPDQAVRGKLARKHQRGDAQGRLPAVRKSRLGADHQGQRNKRFKGVRFVMKYN